MWIIALTKVLSEIAGTRIFVVKITVKSIVLILWPFSHPLMSRSKLDCCGKYRATVTALSPVVLS